MEKLDREITATRAKLEEIKKRWPLHSPKPAMFQEREELELKLEKLLEGKKSNSPGG